MSKHHLTTVKLQILCKGFSFLIITHTLISYALVELARERFGIGANDVVVEVEKRERDVVEAEISVELPVIKRTKVKATIKKESHDMGSRTTRSKEEATVLPIRDQLKLQTSRGEVMTATESNVSIPEVPEVPETKPADNHVFAVPKPVKKKKQKTTVAPLEKPLSVTVLPIEGKSKTSVFWQEVITILLEYTQNYCFSFSCSDLKQSLGTRRFIFAKTRLRSSLWFPLKNSPIRCCTKMFCVNALWKNQTLMRFKSK